jgi:hypothetical protein
MLAGKQNVYITTRIFFLLKKSTKKVTGDKIYGVADVNTRTLLLFFQQEEGEEGEQFCCWSEEWAWHSGPALASAAAGGQLPHTRHAGEIHYLKIHNLTNTVAEATQTRFLYTGKCKS